MAFGLQNNNIRGGFGAFTQQNNNNQRGFGANPFGVFGGAQQNNNNMVAFGQQNNNNQRGFGANPFGVFGGAQQNNNNMVAFGQQNNNIRGGFGAGFGGAQQNNNNTAFGGLNDITNSGEKSKKKQKRRSRRKSINHKKNGGPLLAKRLPFNPFLADIKGGIGQSKLKKASIRPFGGSTRGNIVKPMTLLEEIKLAQQKRLLKSIGRKSPGSTPLKNLKPRQENTMRSALENALLKRFNIYFGMNKQGVLRFSSFIFETNGQQEIQKLLRYEKKSRLA
eukprot:g12130.t1